MSMDANDKVAHLQARWQFGLRTFLLLPIIAASLCTAYVWIGLAGVIIASLVIAIIASYLPAFAVSEPWRNTRETLRIAAFVCALMILISEFSSSISSSPIDPKIDCEFKLRQIGQALHQYHADFGCFPPAYVADGSGQPMHSWRVLLLPYLGYQELYDEYKFDEAWDGPNNRELRHVWLEEYLCHADWPAGPQRPTCYLAVVGNETLWPPCRSMSGQEIGDALHQKILVVEVSNSTIDWIEPRDLTFDTM